MLLGSCGFHVGASTSASDASDATDPVDAIGGQEAGDAPVDTAACPAGYGLTLAATTTRYRVITTTAVFRVQLVACAADAPGATHLASLETAEEIVGLRDALVAAAATAGPGPFFIGAAQMPGGIGTGGWFVFTGGALPGGLWAPGQPSENTGSSEQIANLASDLLHDATGGTASEAVCECDGRPVDPVVIGYVP